MSNEEIIRWLCTPENSGNCAECPYNEGFSEWPGNRLPCGQFRCWVALHCEEETEEEVCDTMEQKEESTMKKYTVKAEYADQIFGGECDTAYVEECMQNGMPEKDVMHLVKEFGEGVLEQFDIEEEVDDGIYETEEDAIKAIVWDSGVVPVNTWKYDSGVGYKLVDWDTYWREVDEAACFLFEDGAGYNGEDPDDLIETYHFNHKFAEDVCEKINEAIEEKKSRT